MLFLFHNSEVSFKEKIQRIRENDPHMTKLVEGNHDSYIQNMTNEEWEKLGWDIANTHLTDLCLHGGALNDHRMSLLFRGLTSSISIIKMNLENNGLSVAAIRSMVPFLQNAYHLKSLDLGGNNFRSEGFNLLFRALRNTPIELLDCSACGIDSMEIDSEHIPRNLEVLLLAANSIDADGCREIAKLLQGGNATLERLNLDNNKIDDDGVDILVDALQSNTSLENIYLRGSPGDQWGNRGISKRGMIMMLKLVNDISSIDATLQSNHTLKNSIPLSVDDQAIMHFENAAWISRNTDSPEAAGREKVIRTQLHSETRAKLAEMQGVNHSLYSEINPLHLPEVLAMVGRHHGQGELYIALKASIAGVISTVNRKQCILVQMEYYASKLEQLGAELAAIDEAAQGGRAEDGESRSSKRRRKWWWW